MTDTDLRAAIDDVYRAMEGDTIGGYDKGTMGVFRRMLLDRVAAHPAPDETSEHASFYAKHYADWTVHALDLTVYVPMKDQTIAEALEIVQEILTEAAFGIRVSPQNAALPAPAPESAEAGNWIADEIERAKARMAKVPPHARPASTRRTPAPSPSDRALTEDERVAARSLTEGERILSARLTAVEAERAVVAEGSMRVSMAMWREQYARAEKAEAERDRLQEELDEHRAHYVDPREYEALREQLAAVEALADEWTAIYERWSASGVSTRTTIHRIHANRLRAALTDPGEVLRARDERVWAEGFSAAVGDARDEARDFVRAITPNPYAKEGEDRG